MTESTWDVIVVGSGTGGTVAAAALSRVGKRLPLLEQYGETASRRTVFLAMALAGAELHYLGRFASEEPEQAILDWLIMSSIDRAPRGPDRDTLHIGNYQASECSNETMCHVGNL